MKLRKALDKAKEARQIEGIESAEMSEVLIEEEVSEVALPDKTGRVSPSYNESTAVSVTPQTLAANRCVCVFPDSPTSEAFKVLRTQILQRTREKRWNSIMVTSIGPGEGKTTTAINLALTFSKEFNQTVLLVDGDLKQQQVHKTMGYSSTMGLVDYLIDDQPLQKLIVWPRIEKLTVISGGKTIKDSTELLGSPRMQSLVSELKNRYKDRYVLFDVPPLLGGADAMAFAPLVDCILIVVEAGKTTFPDIEEALKLLPREKVLGFVLNKRQ